jgi:putative hydrolase of the HAD superfamily
MGLELDPKHMLPLAECFYKPLRKLARPEDCVHDVLDECRSRGLALGIISNTMVPGQTLDDHLRSEGLLDFFQARIYSSEVSYRKPNRAIFQLALSRLGVAAEQSMFVGDSFKADVIGARRAGMVSVWKRVNGQSRPDSRADFIIGALADLPAVLDRLQDHG